MVAAAHDLAPLAREHAERSERERTLAPEVVGALRESPLPSMLLPAPLGGAEVSPAAMVSALEELAAGDASAAWCAMVAATSGLLGAYVDPGFARDAFGPGRIAGGVYAPLGRARREGDAYVVSGRWPFASGCLHANTLLGGAVAEGEPPAPRVLVFDAGDVEIHDTWDVAGLRGTGSHDFEVRELRVPAARSAALGVDRPRHDGPLYAFPPFGLLALGIAAVALGIARAAIDDLVELAAAKRPGGSKRTLAERAGVQADVARAHALVASARAFVNDAVGRAWQAAAADGEIPLAERSRLRLAATHATRSSAEAVDLMYGAAGGTAIYSRSPLQRRFRDVHTATAHMMVSPATLELAGRIALGLETETGQL
mgnify:FL=1